MNTPYGLEIVDNCISCRLKREECFCNLLAPVLKAFSAISHQTTFPPDATLFVEGQTPRGVYLLCSGKVKLFHEFTRRKGIDPEDGGAGRDAGIERGNLWRRI